MVKSNIFLFVVIIFSLGGCYESEPSRSEFVLNTVCTITLYDGGKPAVYREIFARLREIEDRMSVYSIGGDVNEINKSAGIKAVKVNGDVFEVIKTALRYAKLSDGAFDPTVEPLVSLWGIAGENPRVPAGEEIEEALALVNWRDIELNEENGTVFLKRSGMALDLGAIAKGYAADEAARIIRKAGVKRAIIDLGGNILTVGEKKDRSPWKIGIQDPLDSRGVYIGIVEVGEKTVVTSGVYERFFVADGIQYHHIFSPKDGCPVRNGLLSVSIIADASIDGDALSTSAFVLGYDRGRVLVESLGAEAIFVFEDQSIRLTRGVDFALDGNSYRIVSD